MSKPYFGIDLENLPASLKILHLQPEFGIFLIQNEKIVYANKRFQELFDISEEELEKFDIFKLRDQIVHSGDIETVKEHYSNQIRSEIEAPPSKYEYRIITKNKEVRWISFYLINIEYQKLPGILGFTVDITPQKKLEEQYKLLSIAAENSNDAIMICDETGKIVYANKMGEKFSQFTHEELLQRNSFSFTPPEDMDENQKRIMRFMTEGSIIAWETRMLRKDNTILPIEVTITLLKELNSKVTGSITISRDISERKKLEENINRLTLAIEISTDGIIITDEVGKITYCNSAASKFYNIPKDELLNQNSFDFGHPDDQKEIEKNIHHLLQNGKLSAWESRIVRKNQTILPIEISMTLLKDSNGKTQGAISIMRDITERKIYEEERLRAQRLDSLSTLAGGIAHDFNNLLAGILGNIQLMQISAHLDIENEDYLKEMEKATLRAKNLTHQLVTFSKGGNPIQKPESIQDILENSVALVMRGKKSLCKIHYPQKIPLIFVDTGQISQVMNNLLLNADQAMPNGGEINLFISEATENEIIKLELSAKRYLKISIQDRGIGIPPENLKKLFTPYFTTKPKGTGLGLATAYSIIKQHSGYIGVESVPNQGTTFTILLPIIDSIIQKESIVSQEPITYSGNCLIMDDNEIILKSLESIMIKIGFRVDTAINGNEAVLKYRSQFEKHTPYRLVILDLIIPGSMGGKEASNEILKIDPNAKIVISTGYSEDDIRTNFDKFGLKGVLLKPYTIDQMREQIAKIIKKE